MDTLIVVVGPTAAGKTQLGIDLAHHLGGAVVSADSRQVYAGMNIGTASPTHEAMGYEPHDVLVPDIVDGIEHYLLNIRTPDQQLTLADWQQSAFSVIDMLLERELSPLLVGGTMLYVDSVVFNYAVPTVKPMPKLRASLAKRPVAELYAELIEKDPGAAAFVESHNIRRIIRALEVIAATGKPFSAQRRSTQPSSETSARMASSRSKEQAQAPRYDVTLIGLFPGWDKLEQRIAQRSAAMFAEGLLAETQQLIDQYGIDLPLLSTLNYREASSVISGKMTQEEAIERMIRADLRLARRQMSWWRGRDDIRWFTAPDEALQKVVAE